jgi:redox-sensing transcriptional repressor
MKENMKVVPVPTLKRLPSYLYLLKSFKQQGKDVVSCTHIAADLKLDPTQVRKDLEWTGIIGKPKVGYVTDLLIDAIEEFLGWKNTTDAFLVGAGNLGAAILGYEQFKNHGLNIIAPFDNDSEKIGTIIHGKEVMNIEKMPELIRRMHIHIGIIAVPAIAAQQSADILIAAGILAIWNFAPVLLKCPENIIVENVHLSMSLAVLTNSLTRKMKGNENLYVNG